MENQNDRKLSFKKKIILVNYIIFFIIVPLIPLSVSLSSRENLDSVIGLTNFLLVIGVFHKEIQYSLKNIKIISICRMTFFSILILFLVNYSYYKIFFDEMVYKIYANLGFLFIINAVIITPIYEEFIFRFCLIIINKTKKIMILTALISSFIFAIQHRFVVQGNIALLIPIFFLSLVLSYSYLRTKNIIYPILIHSMYNLIVQSL